MSNFPKDMSGTLGANRRREKDSHPTHTGKCMVNGRGFWISAWVKEGRDGSRFFSLSFKPMDQEQGRQQPRQEQPPPRDEEFDDDIPF